MGRLAPRCPACAGLALTTRDSDISHYRCPLSRRGHCGQCCTGVTCTRGTGHGSQCPQGWAGLGCAGAAAVAAMNEISCGALVTSGGQAFCSAPWLHGSGVQCTHTPHTTNTHTHTHSHTHAHTHSHTHTRAASLDTVVELDWAQGKEAGRLPWSLRSLVAGARVRGVGM